MSNKQASALNRRVSFAVTEAQLDTLRRIALEMNASLSEAVRSTVFDGGGSHSTLRPRGPSLWERLVAWLKPSPPCSTCSMATCPPGCPNFDGEGS